MALIAEKVIERAGYTIDSDIAPEIGQLALLNAAGEHLVNMREWNWLRRGQVTLDQVQDVPYLLLPPNTRGVLSEAGTASLVRQLDIVSFDQLIQKRTQLWLNSTFQTYGAHTYISAPVPNILVFSDDLTQDPPWVKTGSPAITGSSIANPLDGRVTAALLEDFQAGSEEFITQTIIGHLVTDGIYTESFYLKQGTAPAALATAVRLTGGTASTTGTITWGATPTLVVTSSGLGSHVGTITELHDGWVRLALSVTYTATQEPGSLSVAIYPAGVVVSALGRCFAYAPQLEESVVKVFGAINTGAGSVVPTDYVPTGPTLLKGGEPIPVLSVWPIPNADETGRFSVFTTVGWEEILADTDYFSIPRWMETLYIELVIAFARGWQEEDVATLSQRVIDVQGGPIFMVAADRDGELDSVGVPMGGGHTIAGRHIIDWGSGAIGNVPS